MSASGLPGRRVEASRAGMRTREAHAGSAVRPAACARAAAPVPRRSRCAPRPPASPECRRGPGRRGARCARPVPGCSRSQVQRALGDRADQQLKQSGVHGAMIASRRAGGRTRARRPGRARSLAAAQPRRRGRSRPELDRVLLGARPRRCRRRPTGSAGEVDRGRAARRARDCRPRCAQHGEEGSGRAIAATAAISGRPRKSASVDAACRQRAQRVAGQRAVATSKPADAARARRVVEHQVAPARGQRLAQRPGRQQPAVAGAALVEHADLDVALQRDGAAGRRR